MQIEPLNNIPVRFFLIRVDDENGEVDQHEVDEFEFLQADGEIDYEHNTIRENGCRQICLTKNTLGI